MPGRGPAPGSEQITRICTIAGWFEFGLAAVQIGGSAHGYPAGFASRPPGYGQRATGPTCIFIQRRPEMIIRIMPPTESSTDP